MAKFCTKCGKALEEGEICSCSIVNQSMQQAPQYQGQPAPQYQGQFAPQYQQPTPQYQAQPTPTYANQPVSQATGKTASDYLKKLFQLFKNILRYPATEGAVFAVSEDRNLAFGLLGAQALFSALFGLAMASKAGSLLKVLNSFSDSESMKMPYFRIFLLTIIVSFALSCALAGILFGISTLFKNNVSFKAALCTTAVRSVVLIPISAVALILSFLNIGAGILLFYMGNLAGICYMVLAFPVTSQENRNKVAFIVFISIVIFAFVSMFIMAKCAPYYAPSSLKESFEAISKMVTNPSSFFEGILGDLY